MVVLCFLCVSISLPPPSYIILTPKLDLYTAATVLLAARLRPIIEVGISEYSSSLSWTHALECLKYFEGFGESAQRCVAALEILYAKVSLSTETSDSHSNDHETRNGMNSSSGEVGGEMQGNLYNPYQNVHTDLDFSGIIFDLHDMSWLNSAPGIL